MINVDCCLWNGEKLLRDLGMGFFLDVLARDDFRFKGLLGWGSNVGTQAAACTLLNTYLQAGFIDLLSTS